MTWITATPPPMPRQFQLVLVGLAFAAALVLAVSAGPANARWGDHNDQRDDNRPPFDQRNGDPRQHDWRDGPRADHERDWNGVYRPAPPIIYGDRYGYYPPPVVYGPGIGLFLPGFGIVIH